MSSKTEIARTFRACEASILMISRLTHSGKTATRGGFRRPSKRKLKEALDNHTEVWQKLRSLEIADPTVIPKYPRSSRFDGEAMPFQSKRRMT